MRNIYLCHDCIIVGFILTQGTLIIYIYILASSRYAFEKASVCYCMASLHSFLGVKKDHSTEAGLVEASKHFMSSAGFLEEIKTNLIPLFDPSAKVTRDFSEPVLSMVKKCNYAPLFYPNMVPLLIVSIINTCASPSLCFHQDGDDQVLPLCHCQVKIHAVLLHFYPIVNNHPNFHYRLAAQCSKMFNEAWRRGSEMGAYVPPRIMNHLQFQHLRYQALSQFFFAKSLSKQQEEKMTGFGEEIARLATTEKVKWFYILLKSHSLMHPSHTRYIYQLLVQALQVHEQAMKTRCGLTESLIDLAKGLLEKTRELLEVKRKENLMVYSEIIPEEVEAVP